MSAWRVWGMLGVVIFQVAFVPNNELNDELVKYFDESIQFRLDIDYTTTIGLALVADFLLLPALLMKFDKAKDQGDSGVAYAQ